MVVLPECFAYFGAIDSGNIQLAEELGDGDLQGKIAEIAQQFNCYLIAGSIPIKSRDPNKFLNACLVFSPAGQLVEHYEKIHLFDVTVADGTKHYRESDTAMPGQHLVVVDINGIKFGLAICYDLRFPGLFQSLRALGAEVIVLPSAFTQKTGQAHWHTLITARAIENQVYMAGCNQVGRHQNGRETFGHSLFVDPWGRVISDAGQQTGLSGGTVDLHELQQIRQQMPVFDHNQFEYKLK